VLSGRGLCDELITRPEESYRLCCVVVCDLETSRRGAPYIYNISNLRVNVVGRKLYVIKIVNLGFVILDLVSLYKVRLVFRRVLKLQKPTISFVMYVRLPVRPSLLPHATTRLPLNGFLQNLISGYFSKICRDNSSLIKI